MLKVNNFIKLLKNDYSNTWIYKKFNMIENINYEYDYQSYNFIDNNLNQKETLDDILNFIDYAHNLEIQENILTLFDTLIVKVDDKIQKLYIFQYIKSKLEYSASQYLINIKKKNCIRLLNFRSYTNDKNIYYHKQLNIHNSLISKIVFEVNNLYILISKINEDIVFKKLFNTIDEKYINFMSNFTFSNQDLTKFSYNIEYNNRYENKCSDIDYFNFLEVFV